MILVHKHDNGYGGNMDVECEKKRIDMGAKP
jgi:hypothetical protein